VLGRERGLRSSLREAGVARLSRTTSSSAITALCCCLALPSGARAQSGGDGFLFKPPPVTLGLKLGYSVPRAGSDLFDFTTEQLTLERADFNAPVIAGELGVRITDRVDGTVYFGYAGGTTRSEFRDWVDTDDRPIEQVTEFARTSLTGGAKVYLADRGRSIGRFAWVPSRWMPYLGASAGLVWYRFEQQGDFVDFESLDIFTERFRSSGSAFTAHAAAGVDLSLNPRLLISSEVRYAWGKGVLDADFVGFDALDLSGFQLTFGVGVRF
jgi:hypothetical protein